MPDREGEILLTASRRRLEESGAARLRELVRGPVDWPRLTALARRHGVTVLLVRSLDVIGGDVVPEMVREEMRRFARLVRVNALAQSAELLALLDAFDGAGISVLPYKGPVLGALVYGDPGARAIHDLDLAVRPPDVWRAFGLLADLGFEPDHPVPVERAATFFRFHCEHGFRNRRGARVELHWRLLPGHLGVGMDLDELWPRLVTVEFQGREVPHFGHPDLFVVLSAHGYKHLWGRLEWLCAVAELLRSEPELDGEEVMDRARTAGAERIVLLAVRLAAELLDAPAPPAMAHAAFSDRDVAACARDVRTHLFLPGRLGFWRRSWFRMRARERWRDRFSYWRWVVQGADDWRAWARGPDQPLLNRALRPVRLLRGMTRRHIRRRG